MIARSGLRVVVSLVAIALTARVAQAAPPELAPDAVLSALAPPPGDDARQAVAIGPAGAVYEPDGKGAWVRRQRFATADQLAIAGRAGTSVVAAGEGVIFRLASNGWSAIRLAQKGRAVMSSGAHAVGAVGRQLYALDRLVGGEPPKLAMVSSNVRALGAGKSIVIDTERGLFRLERARVAPIKKPPRDILGLVGDRWALVDRGVVDLRSARRTSWPVGLDVRATTLGPGERLVAVATHGVTVELLTLHQHKLAREPIALATGGVPVGVAVDKLGRAVIALRDGRIALREGGTWSIATVRDELAAARPGPPPAVSP